MSTLEEQVREAAEDIPGIAVLLVFGSRARGKERPDSDLDVAVLADGREQFESDAPGLERDLRVRLAVALADLAPAGRVDVVLLDQAPATLRQRIMQHGRMVICRDPAAWKALRVATMKEYGDREWARRMYREALSRRLREGSPSGRSVRHRKPLERARRLSREARELRDVQP